MPVYAGQGVQSNTQFLISMLSRLNGFTNGLTDAKIGGITSTGTVAKLKVVIAALTLRTQDKFWANNIVATIDRAVVYGALTDADVETARAAGTFASLITAIQAHTLQARNSDSKGRAEAIWAG